MKETVYCTFCGKADKEVEVMVHGGHVLICNGCVELCNDVIAKYRARVPQQEELAL